MRIAFITAAFLVGVGPALADETIIHRDGPGPGPAVRDDSTIVRDRDCASRTVHSENGVGDSTTVHQSDCD